METSNFDGVCSKSCSPHKTFSPVVGYVQYARTRFPLSDDLYQIASPEGRRTAAVCRSRFWLRRFDRRLRTRRQNCAVSLYRNHIMVEHSQPDGLVSRYEYDRYDTDGKAPKSSDSECDDYGGITVERYPSERKPPVNPLLPLQSNQHPERDDRWRR